MRGRSSSSSSVRQAKETATAQSMEEADNSSSKMNGEAADHHQPAQLSGAYIRSLVKQLTSTSRTNKDPSPPSTQTNDIPQFDTLGGGGGGGGFISNNQNHQPSQMPQQHKKQVRRRLHTSRPYQERLLNMAEARREIVTALKYHRAAMKQQQQGQHPPPLHLQDHPQLPCFDEPKVKSRRNPRTYPSSSSSSNNFCYADNNFSSPPNTDLSSHPNLLHPPPHPWTNSPILPPPAFVVPGGGGGEGLNFPLPNQPLGLNLNLQDFNNIDTTTLLYHSSSSSSLNHVYYHSPSSPSSSTSPAAEEEVPKPNLLLQQQQQGGGVPGSGNSGGVSDGFHHVLDDEEMAEMRSIGEQHQMEWNDTMNLVTSAWWFKFMKTAELGPPPPPAALDDHDPFDEMMEFPPLLQQQRIEEDYNCPQDYYYSHDDPALPCMDIGEIEGMEGEWWA